MNTGPKLFLIDGSSYIYRAYHAIRGLSTSSGLPTNAIYGFVRMLLKLLEERRPEYVAVVFDTKGPTFRHDLFPAYKANRPPAPEDLIVQIPYIKEITGHFNLPALEMAGFEADDLIGTLARKAEAAGMEVVIVTGDKDFLQLVSERVALWDPMKEKATGLEDLRREYCLEPRQMIDLMGLSGDSSDNVPGVPGIGPKTALKLIQAFGSLEGIYADIRSVTARKQQENLVDFKEQAFLSRELVTINTQAPLACDLEDLRRREPDTSRLAKLFKVLEFRQLQEMYPEEVDHSGKTYQAVLTEEALSDLAGLLARAGEFALDTETTSEDPMKARLVGLSFALEANEAFYIPCGHVYPEAPAQLPLDLVLARLRPVLENPSIRKTGQNIKYDWMVLARHGVSLKGVAMDTMLASYLLNPSKRAHNLDQIALDFLDYTKVKFKDLVTSKSEGFAPVPLEKAVPYACEDADITLMAAGVLKPRLRELGLDRLLEEVEMPLVPVLMKMEMRGIEVDRARLLELSTSFEHQLETIEAGIYALAGEEFNIKSAQQLGCILFERLQLPVQKKTRKKTGYSTDMDVLTVLAEMHELPALVLRHRQIAKLKSTYTDALLELIHPDTGRIHTSFNQTITATGRLSSSNPNLQNIPIRTEEGRQIRSAFIPRKGWHLLAADYSQVELRILAHYAQDSILQEAFRRDEDIHTRTALEVFQALPSLITPELRRQAKAINFGIIYGMGPFKLAQELGISQRMAKTYIENYFRRYSGVKRFIDQTIAEARRTKKVSTLFGRIRLLPEMESKSHPIRQMADRIAINTVIQGTAADLIKLAMIRVDQALSERRLKAGMLLSVHDELVFEVPPDELETVAALVNDIMEKVWELEVPLKVNTAWGVNWAEAH